MTDNPNSGFETLTRSQPLRVGFLPLNDCAPLVMARELGLFTRYGLDDPSGHLRAYDLAAAHALIAHAGLRIVNERLRWYCETPVARELMSVAGPMKSLARAAVLSARPARRRYMPSNLFASLWTAC